MTDDEAQARLAELQAEHDEEIAMAQLVESEQLAQNEADNYARLHGEPVELTGEESTEEQDEEDGE